MPKLQKRKLSKKEQKATAKSATFVEKKTEKENQTEHKIKEVAIPSVISVKDFADRANLPVTKIIAELMRNGILATINETIDFETAAIVGDDLGLAIVPLVEEKERNNIKDQEKKIEKNLKQRPPVVTIMGHVDHGKTTLLDYIRKAHVAASESGGITQHISAYQVTLGEFRDKNLKNTTITFIDTPGHAAFSAMREHGASITDIVVLIVAADDGVMPQTKEVIDDAKANNVPVIVAINKTDLPDADVMKTKQQLSEHGLVPEEWGGKTVMVEVSAKTGKNVDSLLEMILLQAEMMDLKANPDEKAVGVVIESHIEKGAGAMALVLIENGTLNKGDPIAIGSSFGKVRILQNYNGAPIESAGPSFPVKIAGLKSVPNFGDKLLAFDNEKEARENAMKSQQLNVKLNIATAKKFGSEEKTDRVFMDFNLILKCDVRGSLEAIKKMISEIKSAETSIKIISEGIGPISESDVTLAKATGAIVIGFRVKVLGAAKKIAETEDINIKTFDVIYKLIDYLKETISDTLPPELIEEELANGQVLAIFRDDKKGFVAGGRNNSGVISVNDNVKFFQNGNEKYRAKILSLRREKSEVKEVESGTEFGMSLPAGANIAVGDSFVAFKITEKKRIVE